MESNLFDMIKNLSVEVKNDGRTWKVIAKRWKAYKTKKKKKK